MNSATIRPELGAPRRSAGRTIAALRAGAVSPTAPRRCAAMQLPARLRAPTVRVAAAKAATARGLRTSFVDGEAAAADLTRVQFANRGLRLFVCAHLDERKPARTPGHLVAHHGYRFNGSCAREQFLQLGLSNFVRQIPDIQLPTHRQRLLSAITTFPSIGLDVGGMSSRS